MAKQSSMRKKKQPEILSVAHGSTVAVEIIDKKGDVIAKIQKGDKLDKGGQ